MFAVNTVRFLDIGIIVCIALLAYTFLPSIGDDSMRGITFFLTLLLIVVSVIHLNSTNRVVTKIHRMTGQNDIAGLENVLRHHRFVSRTWVFIIFLNQVIIGVNALLMGTALLAVMGFVFAAVLGIILILDKGAGGIDALVNESFEELHI